MTHLPTARAGALSPLSSASRRAIVSMATPHRSSLAHASVSTASRVLALLRLLVIDAAVADVVGGGTVDELLSGVVLAAVTLGATTVVVGDVATPLAALAAPVGV
jgi:hypothetical protein